MVTNLKLPRAMTKYYHALSAIQQRSPTPLGKIFGDKTASLQNFIGQHVEV